MATSRPAGVSANHRSGSPTWHGKTGNLCLGVCLGTVSTDTSCFTCFLVWWRFFESDPDQGCCGGQMSRKFGHGSCDFGSVAIWRNGADYVALT
ncbi:Uncharacterised protein [Mycobacterium tuberculosis]|nr:Uncharacterised protein [Mycobacterium tuberculosis]CPA65942.1 Uncharacterised protein [Mycobacterium tuberculosis]